MRFLKSGFMIFLVGYVILISYFLLSDYKVVGDVIGSLSVFNILFSILFLMSCLIAAFFYGQRKNKSGLIGLLCIYILPFITFRVTGLFPQPYQALPSIILTPTDYITFSFLTLFWPILEPISPGRFLFFVPIIMLVIITGSWFIGRILKKHKR